MIAVLDRFVGMLTLGLLLATGARAGDEPITFAQGNVPDREVYVSADGSDSQGEGSLARPFRTLGRAVSLASPGTAIRLLPGTYGGGHYLTGLSGTAEAPLWIGGVPGQTRPVLTGATEAFHLTRVRYLVIENLEIASMSANGINCDDGGDYSNPDATRFVLFRNLRIRDIGTGGNQDALKLSGVNDFWVLDCEFLRGSTGGSGIDQVGCQRGVIARCRFETMGSNAIQCKGGSGDIEVRQCRFVNAGQRALNLGGSTGFEFFRPPLTTTAPNVEARNLRVVANVFEGSEAPVAFVGSVDCLVANNTFIDPTRWVFRILQETVSGGSYQFLPSGQSRFLNNLVYFRRASLSTFVNVGANTDSPSFAFANNLWFAHDRPAQSQPNLPVAESNAVVGLDPRFVDLANADLSVATGSPAIARGLVLPEVTTDLPGRYFASPPTIGAVEAVPVPPPDTDGDGLPDGWEARFGLDRHDPTDAPQDPDRDGQRNVAEYRAGTDPRDGRSVFRIVAFDLDAGQLRLRFATVDNRHYWAEQLDNAPTPVWSTVATLPGDGAIRSFEIPLPPDPSRFYRIRTQLP